ncbi:MAG: hypothetical protein FJZ16_00575 [Candidatus Omnitrophica bacterium]|nr:hypothetical protein [Candidatus Omnitrophota bacterium]
MSKSNSGIVAKWGYFGQINEIQPKRLLIHRGKKLLIKWGIRDRIDSITMCKNICNVVPI